MKKLSNLKWALIFCTVAIVCMVLIAVKNIGNAVSAEILVDGEVYMTIEDIGGNFTEITVETEYGVNVVEYGENKIRVNSADCKNQTCVNYGWVSSSGKTIICAPHKLVVRIVGDNQTATDV